MRNKAGRDFFEVNAPKSKVSADNRKVSSKDRLWKIILGGVAVAIISAVIIYVIRAYLHIPLS